MKKHRQQENGFSFSPRHVLLQITQRCNLRCVHCGDSYHKKELSFQDALRFLDRCKILGIQYVGFTGGEPFCAHRLLVRLIRACQKKGFLFDRITTNGVWYNSKKELLRVLAGVQKAGYDGSFFVSVDAFHGARIQKISYFIQTAVSLWQRPNIASCLYLRGLRDRETYAIIRALQKYLRAELSTRSKGIFFLRNKDIFLKFVPVDFSAAGTAVLKNPWDGKWFREDYCRGPGNVFYVLADGRVKPCCGYASDCDQLTLGNLRQHTPRQMVQNANRNDFVRSVFEKGLSWLRRHAASDYVFPGKTSDHCFFCRYFLTEVFGNSMRNEFH